MRDSHRMKEKYELSLDNRQIVTLSVASLVVLGSVFTLGVVVGKKLSTEVVPPQQHADLLGALDQKTEVLETVKADAPLTFQDELTRKPAEIPEPQAEVLKPVAVAVKKPVVPEAEPTKLPEAPKEEPVTTRTVDGGGLKEAFGKAQRPSSESLSAGSWSIQLSAHQDKTEADRFSAGLRDKGYAPFVVQATLPNKGTWYRVRLGHFPTKEAATRYLVDFRRETSMSAMVTQAN
jgi:DedD protein